MVAITWNADMPTRERRAAQKRAEEHRKVLAREKFTDEEKERWAAMMSRTWNAIAGDIDSAFAEERTRITAALVVELVLDAGRCVEYGGMTADEDAFLSAIYHQPRFQKWARSAMRGYAD